MDDSANTIGSTGAGSAVPAFAADKILADSLQKVHVDLIELHLLGKQAHWNVVAKTSLESYPEGEVDTAETVALITARLYATSRTVRTVHDGIDDADPSTADTLHTIINSLERYAWMLGAENRVADKSVPRPIHE